MGIHWLDILITLGFMAVWSLVFIAIVTLRDL